MSTVTYFGFGDSLPPYIVEKINPIQEEYDHEWRAGRRPDFAAYVQRADSADVRRPLIVILLDIECEHRKDTPSSADYLARLTEALALQDSDQTVIEDFFGRRNREAARSDTVSRDDRPCVPLAIPAGYVIDGRFKVISRLGHGGMGEVYKAEDVRSGEVVALKVLRRNFVQKKQGYAVNFEELRRRFKNEATALARIKHCNVVAVRYLSGESSAAETGQNSEAKVVGESAFTDPHEAVAAPETLLYFAMEFIDGDTLQKSRPPLEAAKIIADVARGLHAAHAQPIYHRDIKPLNIMIEKRTNRAVLTDFGLAWMHVSTQDATARGQTALLHPGFGTYEYMAPEQAAFAANANALSDVYSLGGTLFYLLTGYPPVCGEREEVLRFLLDVNSAPPNRKELMEAIPEKVRMIVQQCLDRKPTARPSSAEVMAESLNEFLAAPTTSLIDRFRYLRYRAAKFYQQRPALVSAAMIGIMAAVVVALTFGLSYKEISRLNNDLVVTNDGLNTANENLNSANENLKVSLDESHARLVDQLTSNADRGWEQNDYNSAVGWFAAALREDATKRPQEAALHRACIISSLNFLSKTDKVLEHDESVVWTEFDPTGKRVVAAFGDSVRVWDRATGKILKQKEFNEPVQFARFLGTGETMLVVMSKAAHLVNTVTLESSKQYQSQESLVNAWSDRAGRQIVFAEALKDRSNLSFVAWEPDIDRQRRFPTPESGRQMSPFVGNYHAALSADGRWLVLVQQRRIDVAANAQPSAMSEAPGYVGVWNVATGALVAEQKIERPVRSVSVANGKPWIATVTADDRLQIWVFPTGDAAAGENQIAALRPLWLQPTALPNGSYLAEFNLDDTNLSVGTNDTWLQYRTSDGGVLTGTHPLLGNQALGVRGPRSVPEHQRFYLTVFDRNVEIADASGYYPGSGRIVAPMQFIFWDLASPHGGFVTIWELSGALTLWHDLSNPKSVALASSSSGHAFHPKQAELAFHASDKIVFVSAEGKPLGAAIEGVKERRDAPSRLRFSPDGNKLLLFFSDSIQLFDCVNRKRIWMLPEIPLENQPPQGATPPIQRFVHSDFSPDSRQLAIVLEDAVKIVDLSSDRPALVLPATNKAEKFREVLFSPDGAYLLTISNQTNEVGIVHLWNVADGRRLRTVTDSAWPVDYRILGEILCGFSADSKTVFAKVIREPKQKLGAQTSVQCWQTSDGAELDPYTDWAPFSFLMHHDAESRVLLQGFASANTARPFRFSYWKKEGSTPILTQDILATAHPSYALSSDGRMIAFSEDKNVVVFDTETGVRTTPLLQHDAPVVQLQFVPGSWRLLATEGQMAQGTNAPWSSVRIWDLESPLTSPDLIELAQWMCGYREEKGRLHRAKAARPSLSADTVTAAASLLSVTKSQAIFYHNNQAMECQKTLDWEQAVRHYTELIELAVDNTALRSHVLQQRGYCRIQQGPQHMRAAGDDFEAALAANPRLAPAWTWLAYTQRANGQFQESLVSIENASTHKIDLATFPYKGWLAESKGFSQLGLGKWSESRESLTEAKELGLSSDPNVSLHTIKALALLQVKTKQFSAYDELRHELIDQFHNTSSPLAAEMAADICTFYPISDKDFKKLADNLAAQKDDDFCSRLLSLAKYAKDSRLGIYSASTTFVGVWSRFLGSTTSDFDSVAPLERALKYYGNSSALKECLLLAMAKQRVGEAAEARRLYELALGWIQVERRKPNVDRNDVYLMQCELLIHDAEESLRSAFVNALDDPKIAEVEQLRQELTNLEGNSDRQSIIRRAKIHLQLILRDDSYAPNAAVKELADIAAGDDLIEEFVVGYYRGLTLAALQDNAGFQALAAQLPEGHADRLSEFAYNAKFRTLTLSPVSTKFLNPLLKHLPRTNSYDGRAAMLLSSALAQFHAASLTAKSIEPLRRKEYWDRLDSIDRMKVELLTAANVYAADQNDEANLGLWNTQLVAAEKLIRDESMHWSKRLELKILLRQVRQAAERKAAAAGTD